jgi:hypothetical protein
MSSIAFTIKPSPWEAGVVSPPLPLDADDVEVAVDGVAAFFGFGPSIVCVLNEMERKKEIKLIAVRRKVPTTYFPTC